MFIKLIKRMCVSNSILSWPNVQYNCIIFPLCVGDPCCSWGRYSRNLIVYCRSARALFSVSQCDEVMKGGMLFEHMHASLVCCWLEDSLVTAMCVCVWVGGVCTQNKCVWIAVRLNKQSLMIHCNTRQHYDFYHGKCLPHVMRHSFDSPTLIISNNV